MWAWVRRSIGAGALAGLLISTAGATVGGGGALDLRFGSRGVVLDKPAESPQVTSLAVQRNGAVVLAGFAQDHTNPTSCCPPMFAVLRLTPNGRPDPTFSGDGKVLTVLPGHVAGEACDVFVQRDGKILAVGLAEGGRLALVRYLPSGRLDSSFGGGGIVLTQVGAPWQGARGGGCGAALMSDGRVVVGTDAPSTPATPHDTLVLARYRPDGSLDPRFGAGGISRNQIGSSLEVRALTLQADGRIVAVAPGGTTTGRSLHAARFARTGRLDASFGAGGIARTDNLGDVYDAHVDGRGRTLLVGLRSHDGTSVSLLAARLTPRGERDRSFGKGGVSLVSPRRVKGSVGPQLAGFAVTVHPDGKLVIAGTYNARTRHSSPEFAVVRLLPAGRPDPTFGDRGQVHTRLQDGRYQVSAEGHAVAVQRDGKVVVAGPCSHVGGYYCAARYHG